MEIIVVAIATSIITQHLHEWVFAIVFLAINAVAAWKYHTFLARRMRRDLRDLSRKATKNAREKCHLLDLELKEKKVQIDRLREEALWDPLTGVNNRRAFDLKLAEEWHRAIGKGSSLSVIVIDVDWFASYNTAYGHLKGDECLTMVAQAMKSSLKRTSDFIARFGGEEFVVVLPGCDGKLATAVALRICAAVASKRIPHDESPTCPYVTVSVGAAWEVPTTVGTEEKLLHRADVAMYLAKDHGRNRVMVSE